MGHGDSSHTASAKLRTMTQKDLDMIKTNPKFSGSAQRGTDIHLDMQNYFSGKSNLVTEKYKPWTEPLFSDQLFESWWPVIGGIEAEVCDLRRMIGGKLDLLLQHSETGDLAIADLKTKGSATSPVSKCHRSQIGGYINLLESNHRGLGGRISKGFILWSRPNTPLKVTTYNSEECIDKYLTARDVYFKQLPSW